MTAFFFFQAEDGIRDLYVTGVQTCALPIFSGRDVLDRVEAVDRGVAVAPDPLSFVLRPHGVRGVFHDREAVDLQRVEVGGRAGEVDGDDRARPDRKSVV